MKGYKLRSIPPEVFRIVQEEQERIKKEKKILQYSFERTMYQMIRDYDKCRKENNFKSEIE